MENPLHYFTNGVGGTVTLLQVMADHGVRNVVYSSRQRFTDSAMICPFAKVPQRP